MEQNIYDLGFDKNLLRAQPVGGSLQPITGSDLIPESVAGPATGSPVTESVPSERVMSGDVSNIIFSGKSTFTDSVTGWRQGIDPTDGQFKWTVGGSLSVIDYSVTRAGVLSFTISEDPASSNAIFIDDASPSNWAAMDIRRSVGTGQGVYIRCDSPAGNALYIDQFSETPGIAVYAQGSTVDNVPIQLNSSNVTSSSFYEMEEFRGGATYTDVAVDIYVADDANPDGSLSANKGSICFSSNGEAYVNKDGSTTWRNFTSQAPYMIPLHPVDFIMNRGAISGDWSHMLGYPGNAAVIRIFVNYSGDSGNAFFYTGNKTTAVNINQIVYYSGSDIWIGRGTGNAFYHYDHDDALSNETSITISGYSFTSVMGVATDGTYVYCLDQVTAGSDVRVVKFSYASDTLTYISYVTLSDNPAGTSAGMAFDGTYFYTTDSSAGQFKKYTTAGTLSSYMPADFSNTNGIQLSGMTTDPDGRVRVCCQMYNANFRESFLMRVNF